MYEEPIKLIETRMRTEVENEIFRVIKEVGVDVNKEELEKALRYDRHQYSKGYKDGYEDGMTAFADRLKEMPSVMNCEYEWLHTDIDNLLKEMAGDLNGNNL